jgi:hypothetical protein
MSTGTPFWLRLAKEGGTPKTVLFQDSLLPHYQLAATLIKRNAEIGRMWEEINKIIARHGLTPRTEITLMNAAFRMSVGSSQYRAEYDVSAVVASCDPKKLCELEYLMPIGAGQRQTASFKTPALRRLATPPPWPSAPISTILARTTGLRRPRAGHGRKHDPGGEIAVHGTCPQRLLSEVVT